MALELKLSTRLSQQLVITPQLQQAIKLLQLSRLELTELIQNELLENPCLEDPETQPAEPDVEPQSTGEKHEQAREEDRGHEHAVDEVGTSDGTLKEPANFDWENYLESYNAPGYALERNSGADEVPTYDNFLRQAESLHDHLLWQLHLSSMTPREVELGTEIVGNINDDGYLQSSIEEIANKMKAPATEVGEVLAKIQLFDPNGVGARDLQECLLLQARLLGHTAGLIPAIIRGHLTDLERRNFAQIARAQNISIEEVESAAQLISAMEPKPGRPFNQESAQYITPDVYVQKMGEKYVISLNEDGMPKLRVSDFYRRALMRGSTVAHQTREYIHGRMRAAVWLIKSIHQRQQTLYKVASSIVKFQQDFFEHGMLHLRPLVLKDVATDISMHESTVSRVTTNKYMHTSRGIFELKFFFNSGISQLEGGGVASETVKLLIENSIREEDPNAPLSDQEIADRLKTQNIDIARRTVAKYRESLGLRPSAQRKRTPKQ
jgi:RNA polymerase sigma-54 factor